MHYHDHTWERVFQCKIYGQAFSAKGNLKIHLGVHQSNTSIKLCLISQKKFTSVVMLYQHINMLENLGDFTGLGPIMASENGNVSAICYDDVVESIDVDKVNCQDAPSSFLKELAPPPRIHLTSLTLTT